MYSTWTAASAVIVRVTGSGNKCWKVPALSEGYHTVAATPARLVSLINTHVIGLRRVTYFVLDMYVCVYV
jgi:superfamily II DNA/RNA helicase